MKNLKTLAKQLSDLTVSEVNELASELKNEHGIGNSVSINELNKQENIQPDIVQIVDALKSFSKEELETFLELVDFLKEENYSHYIIHNAGACIAENFNFSRVEGWSEVIMLLNDRKEKIKEIFNTKEKLKVFGDTLMSMAQIKNEQTAAMLQVSINTLKRNNGI